MGKSATAAATDAAYAAYAAYASYASNATEYWVADYWVGEFFNKTGEDRQEYADEVKRLKL